MRSLSSPYRPQGVEARLARVQEGRTLSSRQRNVRARRRK